MGAMNEEEKKRFADVSLEQQQQQPHWVTLFKGCQRRGELLLGKKKKRCKGAFKSLISVLEKQVMGSR